MLRSHVEAPSKRMPISLGEMLWWVLPVAAVLWGAGAWPMWHWAGRGGLVAHSAAGGVVVAVMLISASVVKYFAGNGPGRVAFAFMAAGLARIVICVGFTLAIRAAFSLPAGALFVSLAAFYMATLLAEGIWLGRALNRDAALAALGRGRAPRRPLPSDLKRAETSTPGTEQRVDLRQ